MWGTFDRLASRSLMNMKRVPEEGPFACPCCGSLTLPARGDYELCPVCFWEDDGQDEQDAGVVRGGPNGNLSLTAARANYATIGAMHPAFVHKVRPATTSERLG
jgi:hypothetical protein